MKIKKKHVDNILYSGWFFAKKENTYVTLYGKYFSKYGLLHILSQNLFYVALVYYSLQVYPFLIFTHHISQC